MTRSAVDRTVTVMPDAAAWRAALSIAIWAIRQRRPLDRRRRPLAGPLDVDRRPRARCRPRSARRGPRAPATSPNASRTTGQRSAISRSSSRSTVRSWRARTSGSPPDSASAIARRRPGRTAAWRSPASRVRSAARVASSAAAWPGRSSRNVATAERPAALAAARSPARSASRAAAGPDPAGPDVGHDAERRQAPARADGTSTIGRGRDVDPGEGRVRLRWPARTATIVVAQAIASQPSNPVATARRSDPAGGRVAVA